MSAISTRAHHMAAERVHKDRHTDIATDSSLKLSVLSSSNVTKESPGRIEEFVNEPLQDCSCPVCEASWKGELRNQREH